MNQQSKSARAVHTENSASQSDWLDRTLDDYNIEELDLKDLARFTPKVVLRQNRADKPGAGQKDDFTVSVVLREEPDRKRSSGFRSV